MKEIIILQTLMIFSIFCPAQEWIFEYDSEYSNYVYNSWLNKESPNTIHGVGVNLEPGSFKDSRTRLVELSPKGELVSVFQALGCNTRAAYHPYGKDSVISVSRRCDGEWINVFNVFNSSGKLLKTVEFENRYTTDNIISTKIGISILRQEWNKNPDNIFEIREINLEGEEQVHDFSYSSVGGDRLRAYVNLIKPIGPNEYILGIQLASVDEKSIITFHYANIVRVKKDKIEWICKLEGQLERLLNILIGNNRIIIHGYVENRKSTIINMTYDGEVLYQYTPRDACSGSDERFCLDNNRLISVDRAIKGNIIYIQEYSLETGEVLTSKKIKTTYNRLESLRIGAILENNLIITGACYKQSPYDGTSTGFVMSTRFLSETVDTIIQEEQEQVVLSEVYNIESLIQQTSEEVVAVKVYPNPASISINFELKGENTDDKKKLVLYNSNGTRIREKNFVGSSVEIDISDMVRGTYHYIISLRGNQVTISGTFLAQ